VADVSLLQYAIPPIAGAIIGYFTNDIAIRMLFRPYQPVYVGKFRLPFTPGLIPLNQSRLALKVSTIVMERLLTPDALQDLAHRLLKRERLEAAIQWLLASALERLESPEAQGKTTQLLANLLQELFGESLPRIIKVLSRREDFLEEQLDAVFNRVVMRLEINPTQADRLSEFLLSNTLPPDALRKGLITFLTDSSIEALDQGLREKTTGAYWLVANLVGAKTPLVRLRSFLVDSPENANALLAELLSSVGIKKRLSELLQSLTVKTLPAQTVTQLRENLNMSIRDYVRTEGPDLVHGLGASIDWEGVSTLVLKRLANSDALSDSMGQMSTELAQIVERYLEKDMEQLVMRVIPILNLDQMIIERVQSTSPQELESAIQTIVRKELQAIVYLGGVLGFLVGLIQLFFIGR
jgi:uncharacterized membrane protein YheB (UPF0754 family)